MEFRVVNGGTHHTGYDFFDDTQFAFDNLDVTTATTFGAVPDKRKHRDASRSWRLCAWFFAKEAGLN